MDIGVIREEVREGGDGTEGTSKFFNKFGF